MRPFSRDTDHHKDKSRKAHLFQSGFSSPVSHAELVVLDTHNSRAKVVLGALLTLYVHCRDTVRNLLLKSIFNADDFEWTR